jgi:4-methylaminobutanoate oxidase (formaldehyde-forming)
MERVTETLGDLYGMHWPYKQHKTSRNQKLLPYHEELKKAGACFGVAGGFERPMWYSLNDKEPKYEYNFGYQNWYPSAEFETKNARKNVGLFDFSSFSKFDLKGKKTHQELQKICTANIKNDIGKTTYTHMLNEDGGIETDLTVVCMAKDHFRVISSAANRDHDKHHILKHLTEKVNLEDITEDISCLGLFGPKSREMISKISKDDFSKEKFSFGYGKYIKIKNIKVWAQRLSYVGELGFELYVETNKATDLYNILIEEGKNFKLSHCGMHAMDIMRMESGFLHWGHDISPEENQYEAGLKFAISFKKNVNFIGKEALLKLREKKPNKQRYMFILKESKPGYPLLLHEEPIYLEDKIIGRTTSGNYSFCYDKNLSFGYVNSENSYETLKDKNIFIEVEKKKYPVTILEKSLNQKNYRN